MLKYKIKGEFIELCNLLKVMSLCQSGGEAKQMIASGLVKVDSLIETRKKCKIRPGSKVEYNNEIILLE
jgi:ribosome-associated protein